MKLLLDESIPVDLAEQIAGYDVSTAVERGWIGKSDGEFQFQ